MQSGISILNDVLGPVMRGPSSSHTAASYNIGRLAVALLGAIPVKATVAFDPSGSYGRVYHEQGVDLAFSMGIMSLPLTDPVFFRALEEAVSRNIDLAFEVHRLDNSQHPNDADIDLKSADGRELRLRARSTGGGAVEISSVDGWPLQITGHTHDALIQISQDNAPKALAMVAADAHALFDPERIARAGCVLIHARRSRPLGDELRTALLDLEAGVIVRETPPIAYIKQGRPLFQSCAEMLACAETRRASLGEAALAHESSLLGLTEKEVFDEMSRRVDLMRRTVDAGLGGRDLKMQLLTPTAGAIFRADAEGRLAIGGMHTRAAARALAAMHVNSGMGIVCAAPTGGSAGVLPGVLTTLIEERGLSHDRATLAAMAAGAIGVIVAARATFAAEIAGCQVEIGAAAAMAAAAVVDAAGGSPRQAGDAAAISFQNTMGSVCDLVQGVVEIPCHTRNAVAASGAFVCADLAMGGYVNPIPLDETVDAVLAVGKMLPPELRVTSRGGLAITPSALRMQPPKKL